MTLNYLLPHVDGEAHLSTCIGKSSGNQGVGGFRLLLATRSGYGTVVEIKVQEERLGLSTT